VVVVTMARMNLYLPDALVRRARTVLPPEVSISAILRRALEAELERFEEIEESEPAG
jgi:post-segregation antitoxin (ccd killing protein)